MQMKWLFRMKPHKTVAKIGNDPTASAATGGYSVVVQLTHSRFVWPGIVVGLWFVIFVVMVLLPKFGGVGHTPRSIAITALEISVVFLLFVWTIASKIGFHRLVAAGMILASGLILAMIVASPTTHTSVHPDEFAHLGAYEYYVNHILPPAVDDPATIPSTSVWGYSYLFERDVVYDIAARATGQLRGWTSNNLLACRLFQLGMWIALCLMATCCRRWAVVLCVVLLSPQIWYLFSYFNADAFPLFLSLIAAGWISDEDNGLNRFLRTGNVRSPALWLTAVCIGLLLVSKLDYLPIVAVFLLWLAAVHLGLRLQTIVFVVIGMLLIGAAVFINGVPAMQKWHLPLGLAGFVLAAGGSLVFAWHCWSDGRKRLVLVRLMSFTLLCVVVATPRVAWDIYVNGWPSQKVERIHAVVEARAGPDFKPSVIAKGNGYPTVGLAARGVPLTEVAFAPYDWAASSLASAFGVYGYMTIFGPRWLYHLMYAIVGLVVVVLLYSLRRNRPGQWVALTAIVVGGTVLVLASSLLLSWTSALQAQGRYLFAILPMIALLAGYKPAHLPTRTLALLVGAACVFSAGSFAFVALPALTG